MSDCSQDKTLSTTLQDRISLPLNEWEQVSLCQFTESARRYLAQCIAAGLDDVKAGRMTEMTDTALDARLKRFRKRSLFPEPDA